MSEINETEHSTTTPEKVTGGVTGKGWVPGKSGNPKGRPKSPSFRALIQAADELKKQEVVDRMYVIAVKGRPVDAARAAEWLAKHSDDKADIKVETEDFTITIAPSAAMDDEEEDDEDGG